jgi:acylphosphatase
MASTVKILVSGRVQGVFFRQSSKKKAAEFGITGSVRNLEDGRVEIIAQADTDILKAFIQWCHKGPITAQVVDVELVEMQVHENNFDSFEII